MAFLTIASIVVPVADGSFKANPREMNGSQSRAYAGNLRSTVRWTKRSWSLTTGLMLSADVVTLENAIIAGTAVSCAGDALGGTVSCVVTLGDEPVISTASNDGLTFMRTMALTLREA
jgi:hypothetical protein